MQVQLEKSFILWENKKSASKKCTIFAAITHVKKNPTNSINPFYIDIGKSVQAELKEIVTVVVLPVLYKYFSMVKASRCR